MSAQTEYAKPHTGFHRTPTGGYYIGRNPRGWKPGTGSPVLIDILEADMLEDWKQIWSSGRMTFSHQLGELSDAFRAFGIVLLNEMHAKRKDKVR